MRNKLKDLEILMDMVSGDTTHINWHEESGGEVVKINDVYILFCIPLFGGQPQFEGSYNDCELQKLIDLVYSWT